MNHDVEKSIRDESAILTDLWTDSKGKLKGQSTVYAFVLVNDVLYSAEKRVKFRFTRCKNQTAGR
jgi:hypothetical protein